MACARPHSQQTTEVEVEAKFIWPTAGGFSLPQILLLLFDYSASLTARFFISDFALDLDAAFILLTYLVNDLCLSWNTYLNGAKFQVYKTDSQIT